MYYNSEKEYIGSFSSMRTEIPEKDVGFTYKGDAYGDDIAYVRYTFRNEFLLDYPFETLEMMIEKGTKATDWTPAPEDVEAEISSLSAELSVQAGIIEGKAESTVVDAQGVRITTAEQTIDAIEGKISLVVTADDKINAEAIASELSVTPSAIDLISDNITLSANQINFDGHVFGENATFTGDIIGSTITSYNNATNGVIILEDGEITTSEDGKKRFSL